MPINVYTGLMGSGKSYEVVSSVILDAVAQGRRVVTNVDGISDEKIRAYLLEKRGVASEKLGQVVHCTNEDVFKPHFLPYFDDEKNAVTATYCQPGDLVCIDEAWRFWGTDAKLLKEHKSFFLEHRHFVNPETKVACDLALMIQDMGTLHRFVRNVVAFTFRTHKKVSLGLSSTYSVNMWEGSKMTKGTLIDRSTKRYKKEIFPLYSSFKGGEQGKISNIDKRQNLLKNKSLWFLVVAFFAVVPVAAYFVNQFFSGELLKPKNEKAAQSSPAQLATGSPEKQSEVVQSPSWRVAGSLGVGNGGFVVLVAGDGRIRLEHPSSFQGSGKTIVGMVDGQHVSVWSGQLGQPTAQDVGK